jgi:hypothetical protein
MAGTEIQLIVFFPLTTQMYASLFLRLSIVEDMHW